MSSEDDTYRHLSRRSFDEIVTIIAEKSGVSRAKFHNYMVSIILNGSRPNAEFNKIWPGWTFEEVVEEVRKRKDYDNGQET